MQCLRLPARESPRTRSSAGTVALTSWPPASRVGRRIRPGRKFCGDCGAPLGPTPPGQKFGSPDAYTPKYLAEKILTSRSALEGERKQVTVLFADVAGFTSLSERLDPEDVHGLMTRAFELMLAEVHRYEGTVNQFLGDGIMALFGAPIAHEDHARRAVQAALAIRRTLDAYRDDLERERGIRLRVRQGLNTGLVVVGSIGSDLRMDYTAVGDTTNVAARLLQAAEPGGSSSPRPSTVWSRASSTRDRSATCTLKGKAEPVGAWELVSAREARSRLDVEAERGLTALVGRERELAALTDCFERARAGQGQMVFVVGEPGIGKSRLVYELRRRIGDQAAWLEGRCVSFGQSIAFHPLIDLLRRKFGIEDGDDEATVIGKIEGGILPLGDDLRPILPYVRYLLAVDPGDAAVSSMDSQERRGELFYALRRLLLREAERRPQVMVYEDLHWTDKATEEFLALVADSLPASPVLLVLTYRTGYSHPFGERSYQTRVAPGALSTGDSVAMARAMLAAERLPDGLQALIARKAEGNPFFVEELVKSLREAGSIRPAGDGWVLTQRLEELIVPETIQDVIAARIDRLPEAPKRALQAASAIGRGFSRRLLDRIVERRRAYRDTAAGPHRARADLREAGLPGVRVHLQARPHAGSRVRLAPGSAPEGAPSTDRRDDRRPVRGPAGRAVRGPGAPLREGRGLGQGARVPHAGRPTRRPGRSPRETPSRCTTPPRRWPIACATACRRTPGWPSTGGGRSSTSS